MSIAGGIDRSVERANDLGLDCLQVFTGSQRRWEPGQVPEEKAERFRDAISRTGIHPVIVHAGYLINLASPEKGIFNRSVKALRSELDRCSMIDANYLVLHPGSHMGSGIGAGTSRLAEGIDDACGLSQGRESGRHPVLLLENMAGQGSSLGRSPEELACMMDRIGSVLMRGICLDTCHLHASGLDLSSPERALESIDHFISVVGKDRVKVLHLNGCQGGPGSRVDRHCNIDNGQISLGSFRAIVRYGPFRDTPMVLETPGNDDIYRGEVRTLRSFMV